MKEVRWKKAGRPLGRLCTMPRWWKRNSWPGTSCMASRAHTGTCGGGRVGEGRAGVLWVC